MAQTLRLNRSLRTLKKINSKSKRYQFGKIASFQDLRSFFYEYSLFIGDLQALPGMPKLGTLSTARHYMLKGGRIMGDVNAAMGTFNKLRSGDTNIEGAGERIFRRFGGRATGKLILMVPGNSMFTRAARSVIGANTQKAFDTFVKKQFRKNVPEKAIVSVQGGFNAQIIANHIDDAIALVTEDVIRQVYPFVPVSSGKLRGTLRADFGRDKARGGTMPSGQVIIGDSTTKDYHAIIEFGSGKRFNVGSKYLDRYFPVPEAVKVLKSSSRNRPAVNSKNGKGAMMRRGARNTIERFGKSPSNVTVSTTNLIAEANKLRR